MQKEIGDTLRILLEVCGKCYNTINQMIMY